MSKLPPGWATGGTLASELDMLLVKHPGEIDTDKASEIVDRISAYVADIHAQLAGRGISINISDTPMPPKKVHEIRDAMRDLLVRKMPGSKGMDDRDEKTGSH